MSPLEQRVTQAVGQAQPGAAVDFGVIMQIMSMVLQFIQQCPFGNARRAIRESALEAKVATYRAVKTSGFSGNPVDLTNALLEQGRQATDAELDETIVSAHALPALRSMMLAIFACVAVSSAAHAGPFPEVGGLKSEVGDQMSKDGVADDDSSPPPSLNPESSPGAPGLNPSSQLAATNGPFPEVGDRKSEVRDQKSDGLVARDDSSARTSLNPESRILNPPALRDRIANYRARGGGIVGVRGMTITTHMLRDHGWSESQLAGLSADELYLLHGMQHAGRINPQEFAVETNSSSAGGYPVRVAGGSVQWTVDGITWSNLGSGQPVEGQVYRGNGRSFVYRGGRMHAADAAPAASQQCAGGRCRIR
jgi:hypothetical protein